MYSKIALIKDLIEFGLSEKEAKVYLALLELGMASVQKIALEAEINRSSTYVVLESLIKQGFVSLAQDDNIQQYLATSPDIFLRLAEKRADRETDLRDRIKNILPELKSVSSDVKFKPRFRVFEGKEGFISAIDETLEDNKEKLIRMYYSSELILKLIPIHIISWAKRRFELGIRLHSLIPLNKASKIIVNTMPRLHRVTYLPEDKKPFCSNVAIWDNKIGYMFKRKDKITTIIIDAEEIVDGMKNIFDLAQEEAKRLGKIEED